MDDTLPTDLWVSAQTRIAGQSGISVVVVRRGDPSRGTIFLKINRLNGLADVYNQVRLDNELAWATVHEGTSMPESEADRYLASQADFDPDAWIVEVEDRTGKLWFSGRILPQNL